MTFWQHFILKALSIPCF